MGGVVLSFASRDFEAGASRRNLGESQGSRRCRRIKMFSLTGAGFPCMFALFEPGGSDQFFSGGAYDCSHQAEE